MAAQTALDMSIITHAKSSTVSTLLVMGLLLLVGIVIILLLQRSSEQAELAASSAGQAFATETPDNYTDAQGATVNLSDMIGQPFVVTTWASWCPHCFADLQAIDSIMGEYPEMRILAINRKESLSQVKRYLATQPNLENVELIIDTSDQFFATVDGYTMPETLVFDASGAVVYHSRGNFDPNQLRGQLDTILQK